MEWLPLLPAVGVCLALLLVPGLLVTLGARIRGFDAVALAPAVSVGLTAVSAVLAGWAGIPWALWIPPVFGLLVGAGVWTVQRALLASGRADWPRPRIISKGRPVVREKGTGWFTAQQGAAWAGLVLAAALMTFRLLEAMGAPQWFSQTYDNNFHLNAVRYIASTGDASSLTLTAMTQGSARAGFYPAAWHDVVSLVFETVPGTSIPAATNVMTLVVGAVVWPLGAIFLVRCLREFRGWAVVACGAAAAGFTAFPMLLIYFGVLYPNFLGLALAPALIGLCVQLLRLGRRLLETSQTLLVGLPATAGISLAHPNALMSVLVLVLPLFLARAGIQVVRCFRRQVRWPVAVVEVLGIAAYLVLFCQMWMLIRPSEHAASIWGPATTVPRALHEALLNNPLGQHHDAWVLSVLALLGVLALVVRRRMLWLVLSYAVAVFLYVAVRCIGFDQNRYFFTGTWYNDHYRLAALLPLLAVPLAVVGTDALISAALMVWAAARDQDGAAARRRGARTTSPWSASPSASRADAGRRTSPEQITAVRSYGIQDPTSSMTGPWTLDPELAGTDPARRSFTPEEVGLGKGSGSRFGLDGTGARAAGASRPTRAMAVVASAVVLGLLLAGSQLTPPLTDMAQATSARFDPSADAPLVNADELNVIEHVDDYVPAEDKVLVDPWNGGSLVYALADREVSAAHIVYRPTEDVDLLKNSLVDAWTNPAVCEAVRRDRYYYVAYFPGEDLGGGTASINAYRGLQYLIYYGVAESVYRSGEAMLLKVTACG